jgi:STE24 endopeptidase
MSSVTIFKSIIGIIIVNFLLERWMDWLNDKNSSATLPEELKGIYEEEKYAKQRAYDKVKGRFSMVSSSFSFILILTVLFFDGFAFVDEYARTITDHPILLPLLFFAILMTASDLLTTPFSWYSTFVIEEQFGFNRTTIKTYLLDKIKGALVGAIIGGGLMGVLIWFYNSTGELFWIWSWGAVTVFMVLATMFYASIIVPLFNQLTPLEDGDLKNEITVYCKKVGFNLDNLLVMDGSKRSAKANAFFSGLGAKKRIVLYDTLTKEYSKEEITAVLAHEIGHYKKKHTLIAMVAGVLQMGVMLFVLSQVINQPEFSMALGGKGQSFHMGLLVFSMLYSPLSMLIGVVMNVLSRKNEYEADNYAKTTYNAAPLVSSLQKLSVDSLSNLTPHPYYVFLNYSHPTLLQRINALSK